MTRGERDLRAQQVAAGALQFIQRPGLGHGQQAERGVKRASPVLACAAASARCARRAGSSVSPAERSRNAAAAARPPRRCARPAELLKFGRQPSSSGPGAAWARCQARRSGSATGSVASASAPCSSCPRLEPMPTGRPPSAPADAGTARGRRTPPAPPPPPASPPRHRSRAARPPATPAPDRRSDQPPPAAPAAGSRTGKRLQLPPKALLDPPGERHRACPSPNPPVQLRRRQPARQLQQRQRITGAYRRSIRSRTRASSGPVSPVSTDSSSSRASSSGRPSTTSCGSPATSPSPRDACREHQAHRVGRQPPGREPERLRQARSSHCWSSTMQISGRSPAASDSNPSTARPTLNRSGTGVRR